MIPFLYACFWSYLVSVHNVRYPRYACPKIARLRLVNPAFPNRASFANGTFRTDT